MCEAIKECVAILVMLAILSRTNNSHAENVIREHRGVLSPIILVFFLHNFESGAFNYESGAFIYESGASV